MRIRDVSINLRFVIYNIERSDKIIKLPIKVSLTHKASI